MSCRLCLLAAHVLFRMSDCAIGDHHLNSLCCRRRPWSIQRGRQKGLLGACAKKCATMQLQDFLKEVDLQFLDHMRRGTSINFADLASDPPPATMQAGPSLNSNSIILIFKTAWSVPYIVAEHHNDQGGFAMV